jgi:hypothetical protein
VLNKLKKWFVAYDIEIYYLHKDMIGNVSKLTKFKRVPKSKDFEDIQKDDIIVYYTPNQGWLTGIFQVESVMEYKKHDAVWDKTFWIRIKPYKMLSAGEFFDFNKFLKENSLSSLNFSIFENLSSAGSFKILEETDYLKIEQAFSDYRYIIKIKGQDGHDGPTGYALNPELVNGLLDYYNNRATSFANLLVASIFGLITLSAIIQLTFVPNFQLTSLAHILQIVFSFLLFLIFSIACYYMLTNYSYYTRIAELIKLYGLQKPNWLDFDKIMAPQEENGKLSSAGLVKTTMKIDKEHFNSFPKKLLKHSRIQYFFFGLTLSLLAVFIYWNVIIQLWRYLI